MNNSMWKSFGVSDNEELLIELLMHFREGGGSFEELLKVYKLD